MIHRAWHRGSASRPAVVIHPLPVEGARRPTAPSAEAEPYEADVLEAETLTLWLTVDGWPVINGYRVTRELCAALRTRRPAQAEHFRYDEIIEISRTLGHPSDGGGA